MAIGSHQSPKMKNDEWLTPPEIIEALGTFDLDPCSPINRPWDTARAHYTVEDNGLLKKWEGRVWMNPPYSRETAMWLKKLSIHGDGIALTFARTETRMFFNYVWPVASAVLFIEGRLHFCYVDGTKAKANSGGPSVLIAYGDVNALWLKMSGIKGQFLTIPKSKRNGDRKESRDEERILF